MPTTRTPASSVGRLRRRTAKNDPSRAGTGALVAVLAAWALTIALNASQGGHHDEISGVAAMMTFFATSAIATVVCAVAGIVAGVRLHRHPNDKAARWAAALAALTLAGAGLLAWAALRPVQW